jgi:thiamine kinase-like enzyme
MNNKLSLLTTEELTWFLSLGLGKIEEITQFTHALTNHVFLINLENGQQVVFKRLNLKARDLSIRKSELLVQRLASGEGISPRVIADCEQYRVSEYITGTVLTDSATTETVKLLATQLYKIHQLPAEFALSQCLADELVTLNNQLNKSIDQIEFNYFWQLAQKLDKSSPMDTLCHGDLSFNNMIKAKDGSVKILDWEYTVLACPAYDLAFSSAINEFNEQQQKKFIDYYYALNKTNNLDDLQQLQAETILYLSVFKYLNKLWANVF